LILILNISFIFGQNEVVWINDTSILT